MRSPSGTVSADSDDVRTSSNDSIAGDLEKEHQPIGGAVPAGEHRRTRARSARRHHGRLARSELDLLLSAGDLPYGLLLRGSLHPAARHRGLRSEWSVCAARRSAYRRSASRRSSSGRCRAGAPAPHSAAVGPFIHDCSNAAPPADPSASQAPPNAPQVLNSASRDDSVTPVTGLHPVGPDHISLLFGELHSSITHICQ